MSINLDPRTLLRLAGIAADQKLGLDTLIKNILDRSLLQSTFGDPSGPLSGYENSNVLVQPSSIQGQLGVNTELGEPATETYSGLLHWIFWFLHTRPSYSPGAPAYIQGGNLFLLERVFDRANLETVSGKHLLVVRSENYISVDRRKLYEALIPLVGKTSALAAVNLTRVDTPKPSACHRNRSFRNLAAAPHMRILAGSQSRNVTPGQERIFYEWVCDFLINRKANCAFVWRGQVFYEPAKTMKAVFGKIDDDKMSLAFEVSDRHVKIDGKEYNGLNNNGRFLPFLINTDRSLMYFCLQLQVYTPSVVHSMDKSTRDRELNLSTPESANWASKLLSKLENFKHASSCNNMPGISGLTQQEKLVFSVVDSGKLKKRYLDQEIPNRHIDYVRQTHPELPPEQDLTPDQVFSDLSEPSESLELRKHIEPSELLPVVEEERHPTYEQALAAQQEALELFPQWAVAKLPPSQMEQERAGRMQAVCEHYKFAGNYLDREAESKLAEFQELFGALTPTEEQDLSAARQDRLLAYEDWRLKREFLVTRLSRLSRQVSKANPGPQQRKIERELREARRLVQEFDETVRWTQRPMYEPQKD